MACLAPVPTNLDFSAIRSQAKRTLREAEETNRMLAIFEREHNEYAARLAEYRIALEVDDVR